MSDPSHVWMVRAGTNNELADKVEEKGAVAIGWDAMADVSSLETRDEFKAQYRKDYPDDSEGRVNVNGSQIHRFAREVGSGEYVLTYIKDSREYVHGTITGPYEYKPELFGEGYPHIRLVDWKGRVSRDVFSVSARNSMGSTLTVFNLDSHLEEILRIAGAGEVVAPPTKPEEDEEPPFYVEVTSKANELISDLISRLDPYDFQDLVAAVLRSMGLRAESTTPGPDRGIDIIAHPDALGFDRPRIKAQVKHRKDKVSGPEILSFLGTLRGSDSGLYVSTGGFTPQARQEAATSQEPVTLIDRDAFIKLMLEHYEELEPEFKSKVPLRNVWVPIIE